jgi:hypothetical protein
MISGRCVFYSVVRVIPPFTQVEDSFPFRCFHPIIRKNPSRKAEIDTIAIPQAVHGEELQICNFGHEK